jgi:8-oxo-dGTP pyrophosphatase MutT (NUDIX family)
VDDLRSALERYHPRDDEAADVDRLRRLVDDGDPWSRGGALHATASALVVDPRGRRVLLRWHARMQRWLQVGGHADPGETDPWAIATREAREETGLDDLEPLLPSLERVPVHIVVVPVPASGAEPAHEHADIRYALATTHPDHSRAEAPDAALRWLGFDEARAETTELNLVEFLDRVERLMDDGFGDARA